MKLQTRSPGHEQAGPAVKKQIDTDGTVIMGSELKRYVTFYFTNVPDSILYHYAKEAFEVYGILDNLF